MNHNCMQLAKTYRKPEMQMVDCKDHAKEFKCDSLYRRRRLRRLMPRPACSNNSPPCSMISSSYSSCIKPDAFSWNPHLTSVGDQPSKKANAEPLVSLRWNPTPEQLKALQEMYQRGVRTPSAEEIQLIAAKLRQFGKIEGKNVFYWFQNHKARERQKRRRQPHSFTKKHVQDIEILEIQETGSGWKTLEAEQNKMFVTTASKCSKLSKDSASMQSAVLTESRSNGWPHLDERDLQQTSHSRTAKGAISLIDLSCMPPNYNHLNTISTPSTSKALGPTEQLFTAPSFSSLAASKDDDFAKLQKGGTENQILQLFPLGNDDDRAFRATKSDNEEVNTTLNANFDPNQFYEFL